MDLTIRLGISEGALLALRHLDEESTEVAPEAIRLQAERQWTGILPDLAGATPERFAYAFVRSYLTIRRAGDLAANGGQVQTIEPSPELERAIREELGEMAVRAPRGGPTG